LVIIALVACAVVVVIAGDRARAPMRLVKIGTFDQPLYVTAPPGDRRRLFVVERTGRIQILRDGRRLATPFLDLSRVAKYSAFENGLLSMAFAPDYAQTGRFYVCYTGKDNNVRVVEYLRSSPERADPRTRRLVLLVRKQQETSTESFRTRHNGGLLLFGPNHLLYIGVGDGGAVYDKYNNAQNLGSLLGKILRIDPRPSASRPYRIPPDNPFVHRRGARPEVYAYGLRNPWRFAFDRTGAMAIADVGEGSLEEIDFAPRGEAAGRNYGWRVFEGFRKSGHPSGDGDEPKPEEVPALKQTAPGTVFPVFAYKKSKTPKRLKKRGEACITIIGGVFLQDPGLRGYDGRYIYGDYCTGRIHSILLGPRSARFNAPALRQTVPLLSSFGEDAAGHVYVCTVSGPVYRLALAGA